jgi:hypothetical protein
LAADIVWRAATYQPPILIGIATNVVWKRGMTQGRYEAAPDVTVGLVRG